MIQIMKLNGTDKQLYKLVAPLVMDPEVLKMNNNYPFKTTDKFVWFVAVSGKKVVGFIPIEQRGNVAIINNYYIDKDQEEAFSFYLSMWFLLLPVKSPLRLLFRPSTKRRLRNRDSLLRKFGNAM